MSEFSIAVPATLSNLGPGFDVLGMALSIDNQFRFRTLDDGCYEADGQRIVPKRHLALRTFIDAQEAFGGVVPRGLAVDQVESVPRTRGLGSSATARVAGLCAYMHYANARPRLDDALAFVARAEGHPDNAVPATVGGLTICAQTKLGLTHLRLDPPEDVRVALCIPQRAVATAAARRAMPKHYGIEDVVFNLSRVAFLMTGLLRRDAGAFERGAEDRVHQPFRKPLIGPVDAAFDAARDAGAAAAFVSGSGSTLAAWVLDEEVEPGAVANAMAGPFESEGMTCERRTARPVVEGAWQRCRPPA